MKYATTHCRAAWQATATAPIAPLLYFTLGGPLQSIEALRPWIWRGASLSAGNAAFLTSRLRSSEGFATSSGRLLSAMCPLEHHVPTQEVRFSRFSLGSVKGQDETAEPDATGEEGNGRGAACAARTLAGVRPACSDDLCPHSRESCPSSKEWTSTSSGKAPRVSIFL